MTIRNKVYAIVLSIASGLSAIFGIGLFLWYILSGVPFSFLLHYLDGSGNMVLFGFLLIPIAWLFGLLCCVAPLSWLTGYSTKLAMIVGGVWDQHVAERNDVLAEMKKAEICSGRAARRVRRRKVLAIARLLHDEE